MNVQEARALEKAPSVQILLSTLDLLISVQVIFSEQKSNLVLRMGIYY